MIHIAQNLNQALCPEDEPVSGMVINFQDRIVRIYIKGSKIHDSSDNIFRNRKEPWLGKGTLIFKNWSSLAFYRKSVPAQKALSSVFRVLPHDFV